MKVIDASALLAFLFREEGSEIVRDALEQGCCMSAVNLGEVAGRYTRAGYDGYAVETRLRLLPLEIVDFDAANAFAAARLLPSTQPLGLSLGDRACLALGILRDVPVLTADRAWLEVAGSRVEVIR